MFTILLFAGTILSLVVLGHVDWHLYGRRQFNDRLKTEAELKRRRVLW